MSELAANLIAFLHLAYFAFNVFGVLAIPVGVARHWNWVRNPWFRVILLVSVYIVLVEIVMDWECQLYVLEWDLRARAGPTREATSGIGWVLDQLLFHTLSAAVRHVIYWSMGAILTALHFLAPPRWRRARGKPVLH